MKRGLVLEEIKEQLQEILGGELPGADAHNAMLPTKRDPRISIPTDQPTPTQSAVLVLFYPTHNGKLFFPLIQRPTYNGAHSAQVGLPGGKAEPTDKDLIETALREANEEIGVQPDSIEICGTMSNLHIWVSNYLVTPVIGVTSEKPNFVADQKEVDEIIEADLFDIVNPDKRKEGVITVREKYKIHTPYFDIDNRVVWGATAMMLNELSAVVRKLEIYQE